MSSPILDLKLAGQQLLFLLEDCQQIMTQYLKPDGYSADQAMDRIIYLLDSQHQRRVMDAWQEALKITDGAR